MSWLRRIEIAKIEVSGGTGRHYVLPRSPGQSRSRSFLGCTPASFLISFAGNVLISTIIITGTMRISSVIQRVTHLLDPYFPMLRYRVVQGEFGDFVRRPDFLQGLDAGRHIGADVSADVAGNGFFYSGSPALLGRLQWIHIKIAVRFLGQIALWKRRNRPATEHSNFAT